MGSSIGFRRLAQEHYLWISTPFLTFSMRVELLFERFWQEY